jgi:hypothetical protein
VPIVDLEQLQLRRPGEEAEVEQPQLAPTRDLFDEGRRLRDLSEHDGLPWRPPS